MRGCITSGEQWAFFVYKTDTSGRRIVAVAPEMTLGYNLEELPLLLGLLRDWVCHDGLLTRLAWSDVLTGGECGELRAEIFHDLRVEL